MASKASAPLSAASLRQGRVVDLAGERIDLEHNPIPFTLQVSRLQRRFGLPEPLARTVAEIAFGWRAAA